MALVFVSYARPQETLAQELADQLAEVGLEPFLDRRRFRAGARFPEEIAKALEDCAALAVILTPDALQSQWVLPKEVALAMEFGKPVCALASGPIGEMQASGEAALVLKRLLETTHVDQLSDIDLATFAMHMAETVRSTLGVDQAIDHLCYTVSGVEGKRRRAQGEDTGSQLIQARDALLSMGRVVTQDLCRKLEQLAPDDSDEEIPDKQFRAIGRLLDLLWRIDDPASLSTLVPMMGRFSLDYDLVIARTLVSIAGDSEQVRDDLLGRLERQAAARGSMIVGELAVFIGLGRPGAVEKALTLIAEEKRQQRLPAALLQVIGLWADPTPELIARVRAINRKQPKLQVARRTAIERLEARLRSEADPYRMIARSRYVTSGGRETTYWGLRFSALDVHFALNALELGMLRVAPENWTGEWAPSSLDDLRVPESKRNYKHGFVHRSLAGEDLLLQPKEVFRIVEVALEGRCDSTRWFWGGEVNKAFEELGFQIASVN